jgi:ribosome-associated protein
MQHIDFELRGEFIPLDSLLKATGLAHSGGAARVLISEGAVQVDGQVELRKTAKMRAGQVVALGDMRIRVVGEGTAVA